MKNFTQFYREDKRLAQLAAAIMLAALWLRFNHLIGERAFWLDELSIVRNLLSRDFLELLEPLDYAQMAPFGFLVALKSAGELLGYDEFGLRIPVFISSAIALPFFFSAAFSTLSRRGAVLALFLYGFSNWLIYYSVEAKQYGFDVLGAVLLFAIVLPVGTEWTNKRLIGLAAVGTMLPWISNASVFVLAVCGSMLFLNFFGSRDMRRAVLIALMSAVWLCSFGLHLHITSGLDSDVSMSMQAVWTNYFAPVPPTTLADISWYREVSLQFFNQPLDFPRAEGIAALLTVIGCWSLWQKDRYATVILVGPLMVAMLVSAAHLYPFVGRLLMFAVPGILIVLSEGIMIFMQSTWQRAKTVSVALIVILLAYPVSQTIQQATAEVPYLREGLPEVLEFVSERYRPGDHIHLSSELVEHGFTYYAPRFGLDEAPRTTGQALRSDLSDYLEDLTALICKSRVWFIFAHIRFAPFDEEQLLLLALDEEGSRSASRRSSHESPLRTSDGAAAYLYEFDGSSPSCETIGSTDQIEN